MSTVMNRILKQQPCINLFVATSKSGKSHLIQYIIKYFCLNKRYFQFGLVLTTTKYNGEYSFLPKNSVHVFKQELLIDYIKKLEAKQDALPAGEKLPPSFLILDDCLSAVKKNAEFTNMIATIRHLNISTFITTQRLTAGPVSAPIVRDQTEVLFVFANDNEDNTKIVHKEFCKGAFKDFDDFMKRYEEATKEKYQAMLVIKDGHRRDPKKNCLPFRAPPELPDVNISF